MNNIIKSESFTEKYKPKTVQEFALPSRIISLFQGNPKDLGHYYFYGTPGTGKTSFVETLIKQYGLENNFLKFSGSVNSSIDTIRSEIEKFRMSISGNRDFPKFILIDEAEGLSHVAFNAFKTYINESDSYNTRFIFTSNESNIPEAIDSRVKTVSFEFIQDETIDEVLEVKKILKNQIVEIIKSEGYKTNKETVIEFMKIVFSSSFPDKRDMLKKFFSYQKEIDTLGNGRYLDLEIVKRHFPNDTNFLIENLLRKDIPFNKFSEENLKYILTNHVRPEKTFVSLSNKIFSMDNLSSKHFMLLNIFNEYDNNFRNSVDKKLKLASYISSLREIIHGK